MSHSIWMFDRFVLAMGLAVIFTPEAQAAINLEFRAVTPIASVGQAVDIQLFAVSDTQANQLLSAVQLVFSWESQYLSLQGNSTLGAQSFTFSGFPTSGHFGLNELPIPQDGDAFYLALSFGPVAATSAGTLLTTIRFNAINLTAGPSPIAMHLLGGQGGETIVASGTVPGLNETGTLSDAFVQVVPVPGVFTALIGGLVILQRPRRTR